MRLAHLALVRSQEQSRHFYETYFSFDEGHSNVLDNGAHFIRNRGGFELAFAERDGPAAMPPFVHFGFRLNEPSEVHAARERLEADGIGILDKEKETDFLSFKCRDPDECLIEVYWSPR